MNEKRPNVTSVGGFGMKKISDNELAKNFGCIISFLVICICSYSIGYIIHSFYQLITVMI